MFCQREMHLARLLGFNSSPMALAENRIKLEMPVPPKDLVFGMLEPLSVQYLDS